MGGDDIVVGTEVLVSAGRLWGGQERALCRGSVVFTAFEMQRSAACEPAAMNAHVVHSLPSQHARGCRTARPPKGVDGRQVEACNLPSQRLDAHAIQGGCRGDDGRPWLHHLAPRQLQQVGEVVPHQACTGVGGRCPSSPTMARKPT